MSHTPGPWEWARDGSEHWLFGPDASTIVLKPAHVSLPDDDDIGIECLAVDRALIATTPDLYEVVTELVNISDNRLGSVEQWYTMITKARAALAKVQDHP